MAKPIEYKEYYSVADTARIIRAILKEAFPKSINPDIKFRVRSSSYAGGASIRVSWVDGPTRDQVDTLLAGLNGKYVDGMIDYAGYNYHTLDGRKTSLGADYIFAERTVSDERLAFIAYCTLERFGQSDTYSVDDIVTASKRGGMHILANDGFKGEHYFSELKSEMSFMYGEPYESPTRKRIASAGDDGYGMGCTGTADSPGGGRGYAPFEREAFAAANAEPELPVYQIEDR